MLSKEQLEEAISEFIGEVIDRLAKEEPEKLKELAKKIKEEEAHRDVIRKSSK